jgi:hypothetical protein
VADVRERLRFPGLALRRETPPLTPAAHPAFDFGSPGTPDQAGLNGPGYVQDEKASGKAYWLGAKMTILVLPAIMLGILLLGGVMLLFERAA